MERLWERDSKPSLEAVKNEVKRILRQHIAERYTREHLLQMLERTFGKQYRSTYEQAIDELLQSQSIEVVNGIFVISPQI